MFETDNLIFSNAEMDRCQMRNEENMVKENVTWTERIRMKNIFRKIKIINEIFRILTHYQAYITECASLRSSQISKFEKTEIIQTVIVFKIRSNHSLQIVVPQTSRSMLVVMFIHVITR